MIHPLIFPFKQKLLSQKKEPTGIADYIGETEPTITLQDPESDYQFAYYDIDFGGWEFGFDNPKCNQMLKEYYNDSNLSIADLGYLQEFYSGHYFGEYEPHRNFKDYKTMNFRKEVELYICDELGLRLYVDEIPSEFFEENFSDYIELFEFDYKNDNGNSGYDALIDILNDKQFDGVYRSTNIDEMMQTLDPQTDEEAFRIVVFNAALNHNITRCQMVYNYNILDSRSDSFDASYIKQVRTTDGKNVLQFKQYQYDAFIKDVQEQECFQFIDDLYKPIDDEDLNKAGIDKDKYDYAFQEVAGIDFDLDYSKKEDSRARTS